ncbi:hypothetical protein BDZ85DRAFT_21285 [Elsinoe ampelina]|uniref:Uncharacterized protein n=1 Tax=Elsinoe ampelina TaxID=302913 RepID=A0A6A6G5Q7_9PEZI|nr:hypothetical protein BDZ85DRAFT_21285 [Elsinoe ampelina]
MSVLPPQCSSTTFFALTSGRSRHLGAKSISNYCSACHLGCLSIFVTSPHISNNMRHHPKRHRATNDLPRQARTD